MRIVLVLAVAAAAVGIWRYEHGAGSTEPTFAAPSYFDVALERSCHNLHIERDLLLADPALNSPRLRVRGRALSRQAAPLEAFSTHITILDPPEEQRLFFPSLISAARREAALIRREAAALERGRNAQAARFAARRRALSRVRERAAKELGVPRCGDSRLTTSMVRSDVGRWPTVAVDAPPGTIYPADTNPSAYNFLVVTTPRHLHARLDVGLTRDKDDSERNLNKTFLTPYSGTIDCRTPCSGSFVAEVTKDPRNPLGKNRIVLRVWQAQSH
jgi:hypothetical protein